jgi:hypothetical protein
MEFKYYMLVSMDNSLKARAVMLTPEECIEHNLYDRWHEDGDTQNNTPDSYLDGYDTEEEALDALQDIRSGNY